MAYKSEARALTRQELETMPARPLSPHIQIYRWTLTMVLSIAHRATGLALYAGTGLLAWWLVALAASPAAYADVQAAAATWVGQLVLYGYCWALLHHMFGGLRHFIWDVGRGFDLKLVEIVARLAVILPLVLTGAIWWITA